MSTIKNPGGYVFIDHRASPGVTAEFIRSCGKNPEDFLIVGEGKVMEADTLTCAHCQRVTILNPHRKRERYQCRKCQRYICDPCEGIRFLTGECAIMQKQIDAIQEATFLLSKGI